MKWTYGLSTTKIPASNRNCSQNTALHTPRDGVKLPLNHFHAYPTLRSHSIGSHSNSNWCHWAICSETFALWKLMHNIGLDGCELVVGSNGPNTTPFLAPSSAAGNCLSYSLNVCSVHSIVCPSICPIIQPEGIPDDTHTTGHQSVAEIC